MSNKNRNKNINKDILNTPSVINTENELTAHVQVEDKNENTKKKNQTVVSR